jgi:hypothetical protein
MNIIDINYDTLMIIVIALFALSGFLRGWWREGITTIFLILLVIFLTQPELADDIISFINNLIKTVFDVINILILIAIVLLSYFTSKITLGGRTISFGGRIFGGILGAINGFLAVNLVKEFIIGRFITETGLSAQAAAPDTLSVTLSDVPPDTVFTSTSVLLVIGLGIVVLALLLANRLSRSGARVPWGYK